MFVFLPLKRDSDSKIYRNVKGSLRQQLGYWKSIEANAAVIKTISEGYKIPFITTPKPAKFKNNKSALSNKEFVNKTVNELIKTGRVRETSYVPEVVNPLSVAT